MRTIIVVGAGASGMLAAITARKQGAYVTLLEQNAKVGKKILSTGNGRCNFTNFTQEPLFYHSDNPSFPWEIIERFTMKDTLRFFHELGIYSKNRNGYMYPNSEQATSILEALSLCIAKLQIPVITEAKVQEITYEANWFQVQTSDKTYTVQRVILACGSKASQVSGADGSGYALASKFGHSLIPVLPALVQLKCAENFYKHLAGVRAQGRVSLFVEDEFVVAERGELQLTKYGISGIPVFQISRYASIARYEKREVYASIDFMQHFSLEQLYDFLKMRSVDLSYRFVETFLLGVLPSKLGEVVLTRCNIDTQKQITELTEVELHALAEMMKCFKTTIIDTNPYEQAQVCRGGVNTEEVHVETLESKRIPGFYFAGEILDVDGMCGGYNLQWAWSSGYVAGIEAAK